MKVTGLAHIIKCAAALAGGELGRLTRMKHLGLTVNGLTGPIPSQLGLLTSTTWLDVEKNPLTGSIPTELGLLSNVQTILCGES